MQSHKDKQDGMVAIVVAMILMIILSLITLGFTRIMQREQRQAIDHSLSVQAFYAAESGINDALQKIRDPSAPFSGDKSTCAPDATFSINSISPPGALNSSYSCLLIDQSPPTLEFNQGAITTAASTVVPLEPVNPGDALDSLKISWGPDTTNPHTFRGCGGPALPTKPNWAPNTGLLRVDLVPADGNVTRDGLINSALNLYLYPVDASCGGTTIIDYSANAGLSNQGQIYNVPCAQAAAPRDCNLTINLASAPGARHKYYLRLKSVYNASNATVTGYTAAGQTELTGAQIQIDATGKVTDVVKRLQVRVPKKQVPIPEFAVQSMDGICKRMDVAPGLTPTNVTLATGDTICN